jgi:ALIX V-shaped domain binding to HIV
MSGLRRCTEVLDEEARCDAAMRKAWGDAWARPQSHVLAASLRETVARYESNMRTAGESDARVLQRVEANRQRLDGLSADSARSLMPTLQAPMVAMGAADPATVTATLCQALAALDALSNERAALEERIKTARDGDNVLPELLRCGPEGADGVFKAHLDLYSAFQGDVDTNVCRQAELLGVVNQNMSAFKTVYDVEGWRQECSRIAGARRAVGICVSCVQLGPVHHWPDVSHFCLYADPPSPLCCDML